MTIPRAKIPDYGVGEKVTSAQLNAIDLHTTWAIDKRDGETDTVGSLLTLGATGRIVQAPAIAPNSNATYQIDGGNLAVKIPSTLTAARQYTLSNTNAVDGDKILFFFDSAAVGSFEVTIAKPGPISLLTLGPAAGTYWAEFMFVAGAWIVHRAGGLAGGPIEASIRAKVQHLPALNWPRSVDIASATVGHFDSHMQRWWVGGALNTARYSKDDGLTFTATVMAGTSRAVSSIASSASGKVVIACYDHVRTFTYATSITADVLDASATLSSALASKVIYDPFHDRFALLGLSGGNQVLGYYADGAGAVWTAATFDTPSFGNSIAMAVKPSSGLIIAVGDVGISASYVTRSTNGGQNWTLVTNTLATSCLGPRSVSLTYNAFDDSWTYTVANIGSWECEVWRSVDDGLTWSRVAALSSSAIVGVCAPFGPLLVGQAVTTAPSTRTCIVYSVDGGINWRMAPREVETIPNGCFAGNGGVMALSKVTAGQERAIFSARVGAGDGPAIT